MSEPKQVDSVEEPEAKEILTEVTTIAKEEEKTGEKVQLPSQQELINRASASMISDRKHLGQVLPKLGKNALKRIILAALELPTAGIPVKLVSDEEKGAYLLAQRIINNRFTITYYHILEESKKLKAEKETPQEPPQDSKESEDEKVP
jgi:hypothetical protein